MSRKLRHLDLFSGMGGFALAENPTTALKFGTIEVHKNERPGGALTPRGTTLQIGPVMPHNNTPPGGTRPVPTRRVEWITKTCPICTETFEKPPHLSGQVFCSRKCRAKGTPAIQSYHELRKSRRVRFVCPNCGKTETVSPSIARKRVYCSNTCRYEHKRGEEAANSGGGEWMRGAGNPNWKGGVPVEESTRAPFTAEIAQWRRRVFLRDGYICQRCGESPRKHGQLRAHHIAPWKNNPELRFDLDNGMTLCDNCHKFVHSPANVGKEFLK